MIVSCPSCSVRFSLDETALGPQGRKVRCSKCAHVWVQFPDRQVEAGTESAGLDGGEALLNVDDAAPIRPRAARRPNRTAARRDSGDGAGGAWLGFVLLAILILGGGYWFRAAIMQALPATEGIYAVVGLGAESPYAGLDLIDVSWKQEMTAKGETVLKITGKVINKSRSVRRIPALDGILLDKGNGELRRWTFEAPESRLLPGEDVTFKTELSNPDAKAVKLTIKLNEDGLKH